MILVNKAKAFTSSFCRIFFISLQEQAYKNGQSFTHAKILLECNSKTVFEVPVR